MLDMQPPEEEVGLNRDRDLMSGMNQGNCLHEWLYCMDIELSIDMMATRYSAKTVGLGRLKNHRCHLGRSLEL
jgi:hypothetical protein